MPIEGGLRRECSHARAVCKPASSGCVRAFTPGDGNRPSFKAVLMPPVPGIYKDLGPHARAGAENFFTAVAVLDKTAAIQNLETVVIIEGGQCGLKKCPTKLGDLDEPNPEDHPFLGVAREADNDVFVAVQLGVFAGQVLSCRAKREDIVAKSFTNHRVLDGGMGGLWEEDSKNGHHQDDQEFLGIHL